MAGKKRKNRDMLEEKITFIRGPRENKRNTLISKRNQRKQ
jgi:hypothetical protein